MSFGRIPFIVAPPLSRVSIKLYAELRAWMIANDEDTERIMTWSQREIAPPVSAEALASEVIWIILCAGRSAQAARTIERKVWNAIRDGRPVEQAFGYRAKARAIERAWSERDSDFAAYQALLTRSAGVVDIVAWCGSLPFVGADTQYQLAKNIGLDLCKPDIWLCRLCGIPDKPRKAVELRFNASYALCSALGTPIGDKIATVDSLLWLACNKGVLLVDNQGGPVSFNPHKIAKRSIYQSAT